MSSRVSTHDTLRALAREARQSLIDRLNNNSSEYDEMRRYLEEYIDYQRAANILLCVAADPKAGP